VLGEERKRDRGGNFHGDMEPSVTGGNYAERKEEGPFTFQLIFQEGRRQSGYESASGNEAMHYRITIATIATRSYVLISWGGRFPPTVCPSVRPSILMFHLRNYRVRFRLNMVSRSIKVVRRIYFWFISVKYNPYLT
jgi:hypothetical protein